MIPAALVRSELPAHAPVSPNAAESRRLASLRWLLSLRFLFLLERGLAFLRTAMRSPKNSLQAGVGCQRSSKTAVSRSVAWRKIFGSVRNCRPFRQGKRRFRGHIPDTSHFFTALLRPQKFCAALLPGRFFDRPNPVSKGTMYNKNCLRFLRKRSSAKPFGRLCGRGTRFPLP